MGRKVMAEKLIKARSDLADEKKIEAGKAENTVDVSEN